MVSIGYLGAGVVVFGKRPNRALSLGRLLLFAPFLAYLTFVWHVVRYFSRESAFNQLTESALIGRRLLSHERPAHFDHIVVLTCEFNEPFGLRSSGYIAFSTLDGHFMLSDQLLRRYSQIAELDGNIYLHCAQGHGRTATFASAYLLYVGISTSVDDLVEYVSERRSDPHLNRSKRAMYCSIDRGG